MSISSFVTRRVRSSSLALAGVALVAAGCTENLPSGPASFSASIRIVVPHDTIVVGDSSAARAEAIDGSGRVIQGLSFAWVATDPTIIGVVAPLQASDDATANRTKTLVGLHTGRTVLTLALPDDRFIVPNATRTETVVVGGVRISTTRDSTLTAINDTVRAIAAGLVRANGALVPRVSQGIKWVHLGSHLDVVGTGDTIRYVARSNGVDTLIATHDFCLAGAACADTAIIRVSQQLSITLSSHAFQAYSLSDTLGPTVTLADRRGNGLPGTSIRLTPLTAADAAIVGVTAPLGIANPTTGVLATPRLISLANGTARVAVQGIAADGITLIAADTIVETVRQVARRVSAEPLRATLTFIDSLPVRLVARDARGAPIADATVTAQAVGIPFANGIAGPTAVSAGFTQGSITPSVFGSSLPELNPGAPQVAVTVDRALITLVATDTVVAGNVRPAISTTVLDSLGRAAVGKYVRFGLSTTAPFGSAPDSVQVDGNGVATLLWTPPTVAGSYTLTGVTGITSAVQVPADSAGKIVIRRTTVVIADVPAAARSFVSVGASTVASGGTTNLVVTIRDRFGNPVLNATPADFNITVTRGTLGAFTCGLGSCSATYTAPATAGADAISVTILGLDILLSPLALTIT